MTDVEDVRRERAIAGRGDIGRAWHVVLAVAVAASFGGQVYLLIHGTDVNAAAGEQAVGLGVRFGRLFSYFTIESNLLVLMVAISLALHPFQDGRLWRVLRLDALLGIVITGLVFGVVLAGLVHHTGLGAWVNAGFHYFAPWWALAGWLLFGTTAADRLVDGGVGLCLARPVDHLHLYPRRRDRVVSVSVPGRAHARLRDRGTQHPFRGHPRRRHRRRA